MIPVSKDIAQMLQGESSLGLTIGTDLFISRMPDAPDNCVAVFDNPGSPPLLAYKQASSDYFYSSVSIQVRDTDYPEAYGQAFDILTFLHAKSQVVVELTYYALIRALDEPQLLHWDGNDRAVLVLNFEVQRSSNVGVMGSAFTSGFSDGFN